MKIEEINIREILDSRDEASLEVELVTSAGAHTAQVPQGKSRGSGEAPVLTFAEAEAKLASSREALSRNWQKLEDLESVVGPSNLGLGIGMAGARALAAEQDLELSAYLRKTFFPDVATKLLAPRSSSEARCEVGPMIFANVINGGEHSTNNLEIQEFMFVLNPNVGSGGMHVAVEEMGQLYKRLGEVLTADFGINPLPLGNEGGYDINFKDSWQPLTYLKKVAQEFGLPGLHLAMDCAANSFYESGVYSLGGIDFSAAELLEEYMRVAESEPLIMSIEDPFQEHDSESFEAMRKRLPNIWVVGDDLTVTNAERITKFAAGGAINAVIIKPTQAGSVAGACKAILAAQASGVKTTISHRSAEVADNFIIDLAHASGADAVKIGAPIHERVEKYNRLLRLYK